jgi:hypothetical protein
MSPAVSGCGPPVVDTVTPFGRSHRQPRRRYGDPVSGQDVGPLDGRQATALADYAGQWVALSSPTEVLVAADSPEEVLTWLKEHGKQASYGVFRVPTDPWEAEGLAPL